MLQQILQTLKALADAFLKAAQIFLPTPEEKKSERINEEVEKVAEEEKASNRPKNNFWRGK